MTLFLHIPEEIAKTRKQKLKAYFCSPVWEETGNGFIFAYS